MSLLLSSLRMCERQKGLFKNSITTSSEAKRWESSTDTEVALEILELKDALFAKTLVTLQRIALKTILIEKIPVLIVVVQTIKLNSALNQNKIEEEIEWEEFQEVTLLVLDLDIINIEKIAESLSIEVLPETHAEEEAQATLKITKIKEDPEEIEACLLTQEEKDTREEIVLAEAKANREEKIETEIEKEKEERKTHEAIVRKEEEEQITDEWD